MRLEPICALYPANSTDTNKLARLDWPEGSNQVLDLSFLSSTRKPALLAYRIQRDAEKDSWGLIGCVASNDYAARDIMPHEETLVETVRVRSAYLHAAKAQTGPVLLAGKGKAVEEALTLARNEARNSRPLTVIQTTGRTDTLWALSDACANQIQALLAYAEKPLIADGHHRAKATAATCDRILVALFAEKDFCVGACERLVTDVKKRHNLAESITDLELEVTPTDGTTPASRHAKLWDGRAWHDIALGNAPQLISDSRLLQDKILSPALGITDPTTDPRLVCLPACNDPRSLESLTQGGRIALRLHPCDLELVYQMANQSRLMPPKTTWFTPKPLPGIVARRA